jgi:hypothetical protein
MRPLPTMLHQRHHLPDPHFPVSDTVLNFRISYLYPSYTAIIDFYLSFSVSFFYPSVLFVLSFSRDENRHHWQDWRCC